jgi:ribosomal protein S6--L-glutamate ligase
VLRAHRLLPSNPEPCTSILSPLQVWCVSVGEIRVNLCKSVSHVNWGAGTMNRLRVAIGEQLRACPNVVTLGVRSQLGEYNAQERKMILEADILFYPTVRFIDIFAALGKETFPSVNCYRLLGDKQKQTTLFRLLNVPHPHTRVYYGHKQKQQILEHFAFPLVAKKALRSSGGRHVFLIRDLDELEWYKRKYNPAYIQEYIVGEGELRVIVLNYRIVLGYWRIPASGDFRCNVAQGGSLLTGELPREAVSLAGYVASAAELSDVAVDMIFDGKQFWVLELNFRYGDRGWRHAGLDRIQMIMAMIEEGEL